MLGRPKCMAALPRKLTVLADKTAFHYLLSAQLFGVEYISGLRASTDSKAPGGSFNRAIYCYKRLVNCDCRFKSVFVTIVYGA